MLTEGYKFGAPVLLLGAGALFFGPGESWRWAGGVVIFLGLFVFYFFRNPERRAQAETDAVLSPADGHVVEIAEEPLEGRAGRRISIFLSIWDVHVQRMPVAGEITRVEYRPGRYYAAFRKAASVENEQNLIRARVGTAAEANGEFAFKQIAGAIARRVICWRREGETVGRGERIGLIRFGSRVDLWLPIEAQITAKRGQRVRAGETILARWNPTS